MTGFYLQGPRLESVFAVTLVVFTSIFLLYDLLLKRCFTVFMLMNTS